MCWETAYEQWLNAPALSQQEQEELRAIQKDKMELRERFCAPLAFGTAGLRGTMKVGLHHMNVHVVRWVTQGFAEVICAESDWVGDRKAAVCMDGRKNSRRFAEAAAEVLAANGITVYLFDGPRPTPELSFAVRAYGCLAGINITASHNPKEYNGYKAYWCDGAQLQTETAMAVSARLEEIDVFAGPKRMDLQRGIELGRICLLGRSCDEAYLKAVEELSTVWPGMEADKEKVKIVYTPLHGCGYQLVPEILCRTGLQRLLCEPSQMVLDGDFSTVESPNPEYPESFARAAELAIRENADLILGTDPDCDRVGLLVRGPSGKFLPLSCNQTGVLLLDYLIGAQRRSGRLPQKAIVLKTIVTTDMARAIAQDNGIACYDTFTGFRFLAQRMEQLEQAGAGEVIFSFEEAYGCMIGHHVRDKDGVSTAMLIGEMAAWYAGQNCSLYDALQALYTRYGWYGERTEQFYRTGQAGAKEIADFMTHLREAPPKQILGTRVVAVRDYLSDDQQSKERKRSAPAQASNVLRLVLQDGAELVVRPSGTEPKIKFYILVCGDTPEKRDALLERYASWINGLEIAR